MTLRNGLSGRILVAAAAAVLGASAAHAQRGRSGGGVVDSQLGAQATQAGNIVLINLNPIVGAWYLLQGPSGPRHIEVPDGARVPVSLTATGLSVGGHQCSFSELEPAGAYKAVCGGLAYVRGQGPYRIAPEDLRPSSAPRSNARPAPARLALPGAPISYPGLGLALEGGSANSIRSGEWYGLPYTGGAFFTAFQPRNISPDVLRTTPVSNGIWGVTPVRDITEPGEANSPAGFVAFDLAFYQAGWMHGVNRPGGGPSPAPLVLNGVMNPRYLSRLAATVAGGFNGHDGFRYGPLVGSPYGYVQDGVVLIRPSTHLATFIAYADGRIDIKTWTSADNASLPSIRWLRQNGVPLVENSLPGSLVGNPGAGNWSARAQKDSNGNWVVHSPRSGMCLLESGGRRYLVYGFLPDANPWGMARSFQAIGCRDAIHLDMNSHDKAFFGLFANNQTQVMSSGMGTRTTNGSAPGVVGPRGAIAPFNDDTFFILRRQ